MNRPLNATSNYILSLKKNYKKTQIVIHWSKNDYCGNAIPIIIRV